MKVSELCERSGIGLPTIKFYIREGLLPPGARTGRNQADYGEEHLERLALIRALREVASLPIETIARALKAADETREDFFVAAVDALERPLGPAVDVRSAAYKKAERTLLALAQKRGWAVEARDASLRDAARALSVVEGSFPYEGEEALLPYAEAADRIAEHELPESWPPDDAPEAALRYALLGTVLFEPLILALRRMAHVARTRKALGLRKRASRSPKGRARRREGGPGG